ncbi:MAG: LbtU family siderophore porin [Gammaproteobacteria bacterium]|nr:LbtU family siderophore porin [Gammaproteobacteria bacterium]
MRLKPVVASIVLLGLSSTAFAATKSDVAVQNRLNSMQIQLNQLEQSINQNNGGTTTLGGTALQKRLASCPNWYDNISVSGLINVDGILSSRRANFIDDGEHFFGNRSASDLALDNADLFVDARINSWTKAHIGINYQDNNNNYSQDNEKSQYDTNASRSLIIKPWSGSLIDEAYVTFGDFCRSPIFFRVGKQYLNFGNYDRFATVPTFTQLLSQTNDVAATLGFVQNGLYGSVYGFRGIPSAKDNANGTVNINNWGANLGWGVKQQGSSLNLQAGYLNNLADVDYISSSLVTGTRLSERGYNTPVGGVSLDASGTFGMLDGYAHYVTSIKDFGANEVTAEFNHGVAHNDRGAGPSAIDVGAGLTTNVMNHKSRFGLDYQYSWDAVWVGLYGIPEARVEGTFDMNVSRNVNVGLYVYHDQDYDVSEGGSGRGATTGVLHLGVMFA